MAKLPNAYKTKNNYFGGEFDPNSSFKENQNNSL